MTEQDAITFLTGFRTNLEKQRDGKNGRASCHRIPKNTGRTSDRSSPDRRKTPSRKSSSIEKSAQ